MNKIANNAYFLGTNRIFYLNFGTKRIKESKNLDGAFP